MSDVSLADGHREVANVLEEFRRRFKSSPEFRARFIDDAHD